MPRTRRFAEPYCFVPQGLEQTFAIDPAKLSGGAGDFAHALFAPIHYEPGYAYPLIVWLHGCGGDERQLRQLMPLLSLRNYLAVARAGCRCPARRRQSGRATDGGKPKITSNGPSSGSSIAWNSPAGNSTSPPTGSS